MKHIKHVKDCAWQNAECEYKATHYFCPHPEHECTCPPRIYVASRASIPGRADMWRAYRDNFKLNIVSTWIDEDGAGETQDFSELWARITEEIKTADRFVLFAEPDDFPLKGALIEAGIALGMNKEIIVCLPLVQLEQRSMRPIGSWVSHPLVTRIDNIHEAMEAATKARRRSQ